jgi:hypothetical protein
MYNSPAPNSKLFRKQILSESAFVKQSHLPSKYSLGKNANPAHDLPQTRGAIA